MDRSLVAWSRHHRHPSGSYRPYLDPVSRKDPDKLEETVRRRHCRQTDSRDAAARHDGRNQGLLREDITEQSLRRQPFLCSLQSMSKFTAIY